MPLAPAPHGPRLIPSGPTLTRTIPHLEPISGSLIFSQGDREIGSRARDLGFTHREAIFGATQTAHDRLAGMLHPNWDISERVVAACIEVHRHLGPGLLESVYGAALCEELTLQNLPFKRQCVLPVAYKGRALEQTYRADLIVADQLLVEVKSVEAILFVHVAQAVTYLRITELPAGLIVNFNTPLLRSGLRRVSLPPKTRTTPDLPTSL